MRQGNNQSCAMKYMKKSSCGDCTVHFPGTFKRVLDVVKVNVNIILTTILCTALLFGSIGCNQAEVLAKSPKRPEAKPFAVSKKDKPEPFDPVKQDVTKEITRDEVKYELLFEPRANPFALRENKNRSKKITANMVHANDIKLLGLMNDGQKSLAAIEIRGKSEIVHVGSRLGAILGVSGIRVLQIHDSDIVIEQDGKQIMISLPIPR